MTVDIRTEMVKIDAATSLENFRRFVIASTCSSYAPQSYADDTEVFPERDDNLGSIYVEAVDKVTLKKIRDMTFVNARDVLGIIYNSKSGNTSLKWRQIRHNNGKVSGEASTNSLVNLAQSGVITLGWVENYVRKKTQEK
jgi:Mrp family chromosome partitioning ATPase